jgi:hypothetical protein
MPRGKEIIAAIVRGLLSLAAEYQKTQSLHAL